MAIIIKNIDMPKNCHECPLHYIEKPDDAYFGDCVMRCVIDGAYVETYKDRIYEGCQLEPLDNS